VTDALSDEHARRASFGAHSALELPFPAAAKTGTSKGFRDNIAVGYTPEVTVAVWVGNFDGSAMRGVSGVTGAGPLMNAALVAAMRGRPERAFDRPEGLEEAEVCELSGERPGPHCAHRRTELFARNDGTSTIPTRSCTMHEVVRVHPADGKLASPDCPGAEERIVERFEPPFSNWAIHAGRPIAPREFSPRCPHAHESAPTPAALHVAFPIDGSTFVLDPGSASRQALALRAEASPETREVDFVVDGARIARRKAPFSVDWPLATGEHTLTVVAAGASSEPVRFRVE
jgi:penicillin-binding protein 1C